jgi:hypothetical protein
MSVAETIAQAIRQSGANLQRSGLTVSNLTIGSTSVVGPSVVELDETRNDGDDDRGLLLFTGAELVAGRNVHVRDRLADCVARTTGDRRLRREESLRALPLRTSSDTDAASRAETLALPRQEQRGPAGRLLDSS